MQNPSDNSAINGDGLIELRAAFEANRNALGPEVALGNTIIRLAQSEKVHEPGIARLEGTGGFKKSMVLMTGERLRCPI